MDTVSFKLNVCTYNNKDINMYNVHDFTSISKHIDNYVNNIWEIQFNVA